MRIPTALLRIGAELGIKNAQKTLEGRRALKTSILTTIANANKEWKEARQLGIFRNPLHMPSPTSISNWRNLDDARPAVVLPRASLLSCNQSWLHHGSGAASTRAAPAQPSPLAMPAPATVGQHAGLKRVAPDSPQPPARQCELHPNGLQNQQDFLDPRCDRLAVDLYGEAGAADFGLGALGFEYSTINADLFDRPDGLPIAIASVEAAHPWNPLETRHLGASDAEAGCDMPAEPAAEPAAPQPEALHEIEAFDAMLGDYSENEGTARAGTPPPPAPPMPEAGSSSVPSSPPSPFRVGPASASRPAHADLMAELLAALAQRQPPSPVAQAEKPLRSDVEDAFLGAFALMDNRFALTKANEATDTDASDAASSSSDSGRGSAILEFTTAAAPGRVMSAAGIGHVVADHEWDDSTA